MLKNGIDEKQSSRSVFEGRITATRWDSHWSEGRTVSPARTEDSPAYAGLSSPKWLLW